MRNVIISMILTLVFAGVALAEENPKYRALAEYYAPVVYQESKSAVLDFITKFDYDGDWNGSNNWRNAYLHDLAGYVYYAVIESTNHYFITYSFFHPRDYTAQPFEGFAPKTEHENDMEGMTLTIEKDTTEFGRPILLETLAHDHFYIYANPDYVRVQSGRVRLDGPIIFLSKQDAMHQSAPAIYIEPEGHGVKAAGADILAADFDFPGIIYRFTGRGAEVPRNNRDPDASYDLISIEDTLWQRRFEIGNTYCCGDNYAFPAGPPSAIGSAFNGPIGGCAAKPPWGWDQADDTIVKGDWFRDPLKAYSSQLRLEGFNDVYVWNPYLRRDGNSATNMCSASKVSQTVKGSIATSLLGIARAVTSGGLSQAGANAKKLFLGDTALLEWSRNADFEKWSWDKALAVSPTFKKEGLQEEMSIPLKSPFAFSSPGFKVASRYFDSVVMKYRCAVPNAKATVFWTYVENPDFYSDLSASIPICGKSDWVISSINLTGAKSWDSSKTVVKIKIEITAGDQKIATIDPARGESDSPEFVLNYLVFDRAAFSDTFQR
jgi:hypothetical protein